MMPDHTMEDSMQSISLSEYQDNQHLLPHFPMGSQQLSQSSLQHSHESPSSAFTPPQHPHLVWRRVAELLSDHLPTLLALASVNDTLKCTCRLYISDSFHEIVRPGPPPLSHHYLHHNLLWLILHGYLDPTAVTDFYYYEGWEGKPPKTASPGNFVTEATAEERKEFFELVAENVRQSSWIPDDRKDEAFSAFQEGGRDAALAILLPLFTRLKSIDAPVVDGPLCAAVFRSIGDEYQRRKIDPKQARQRALDAALRDRTNPRARDDHQQQHLPFSNLLILSTRAAEYGLGPPLSDVIPFLGIPSLQRIILKGVRDREFSGWEPHTPRPSAPEIYFQQSSVSKVAALAFAQGLFPGPCEIRQWFESPYECWPGGVDFPEHADWDRILIDESTIGGKLETKMNFEGGNPGCDHAWVSWLCREKMRDWKRMDEEFEGEDDDDDHDELSGVMGRF